MPSPRYGGLGSTADGHSVQIWGASTQQLLEDVGRIVSVAISIAPAVAGAVVIIVPAIAIRMPIIASVAIISPIAIGVPVIAPVVIQPIVVSIVVIPPAVFRRNPTASLILVPARLRVSWHEDDRGCGGEGSSEEGDPDQPCVERHLSAS
jgi:hypothetical protein